MAPSAGHISSDRLLTRQAETYEAKIQAMGELLESEKRLALETQVRRVGATLHGGDVAAERTITASASTTSSSERPQRTLTTLRLMDLFSVVRLLLQLPPPYDATGY
jgi:hypothetical protein